MAKKKKSQRKRNLAYANRQAGKAQIHASKEAAVESSQPQEQVAKAKPVSKSSVEAAGLAPQKLAFIKHDLRTIALLAAGCIALELVLWYLLQHTGLGTTVFGV